eukprot:gene7361-3132_t
MPRQPARGPARRAAIAPPTAASRARRGRYLDTQAGSMPYIAPELWRK